MCSAFLSSVFCHLHARQLLPMRALSPRRRRCSAVLQRDFRVLAAAFFYGVLLWHCGTTRSVSKRLFLPTFSGKTDGTKLQTSEAFAIWRGRATERTRPAACGGARDVEFVRTSRRRHSCGVAAFNGSSVKPDKRADVHPQGVGRIRSAPSSLTAALAIGPYRG